MGAFSNQFSVRVQNSAGAWRTYTHPHQLQGQAGTISGTDPSAVAALRKGQDASTKDIWLTQPVARKLAAELVDGSRIAAYEKMPYLAALWAAEGRNVEVTDDTGHWRPLIATAAGAAALFAKTDGVRVA
ncbi:MAG: hypothetical protein IT381_12365 [Deltaproteobacteria bacterium]|nr:hypothetical protein [Deltaproteobacteria bacterium]